MFFGWSLFDNYARFKREVTELMIEKIVKLIPLLILCGLLWGKNFSNNFIFICWVIMLQHLLVDWGIFYKTATVVTNDVPLSGFIVLLMQSIYFHFFEFCW